MANSHRAFALPKLLTIVATVLTLVGSGLWWGNGQPVSDRYRHVKRGPSVRGTGEVAIYRGKPG